MRKNITYGTQILGRVVQTFYKLKANLNTNTSYCKYFENQLQITSFIIILTGLHYFKLYFEYISSSLCSLVMGAV